MNKQEQQQTLQPSQPSIEAPPTPNQVVPNQTVNSPDAAFGKAFNELATELRTSMKEIKDDARDQKNYLLIGVFILGVMVATMLIMVGGMVMSAYNNQAATDALLNANINTLLTKLK